MSVSFKLIVFLDVFTRQSPVVECVCFLPNRNMIVYVNPDDTTVDKKMAKIKTQMYGLKRDFILSLLILVTASWLVEINLPVFTSLSASA